MLLSVPKCIMHIPILFHKYDNYNNNKKHHDKLALRLRPNKDMYVYVCEYTERCVESTG